MPKVLGNYYDHMPRHAMILGYTTQLILPKCNSKQRKARKDELVIEIDFYDFTS